jgi:hypothetical protein
LTPVINKSIDSFNPRLDTWLPFWNLVLHCCVLPLSLWNLNAGNNSALTAGSVFARYRTGITRLSDDVSKNKQDAR